MDSRQALNNMVLDEGAGRIRSTLRNPSCFWSLSYCADEIDEILNAKEEESKIIQKIEERKEEG